VKEFRVNINMKIKEGVKWALEIGYSVGLYDLTLEISKYMTV